MYGYGGISASGLGGLLVGGAKPIRNRGDALRNMLQLENAEHQVLSTLTNKRDLDAFRTSDFGQAMARDEAQLGRYRGQFNQIYPEIGEFYHARTQAPGYVPAPPRKKYDFSHVPMNPGFVPPGTQKVLNPVSGKMVGINSAIGKRLVRRYTTGLGAGLTGY